MKTTLLCSLFLFLSLSITLSLEAQVNHRDIVYLKNGSIIKGVILEMIPSETIKIKTSDGSIFIYKMEEVEKTMKEEFSKSPTETSPSAVKEEEDFSYKGYFIITRLGPTLKDIGDSELDITLGIINGYQINDYLSFGVGVETTRYNFSDGQSSEIRVYPVFFDTRFYIPKHRIKPMFSFQFGYGIASKAHVTVNQNTYYTDFIPADGKGGLFMSIGAGMRIYATKRVSFVFDGGIALQSLSGKYDYQSDVNTSKTFPALRINLGLAFNLGRLK